MLPRRDSLGFLGRAARASAQGPPDLPFLQPYLEVNEKVRKKKGKVEEKEVKKKMRDRKGESEELSM